MSVLVVDDERTIADSLTAILNAKGYQARSAYSAEEALRLVDESRPDVLISDVMMPGINGIELSQHFARAFPGCKVLLMSGNFATAALLAESQRQGYVHTILAKPAHPTQILELLTSYKRCP